MALTDAFCRHIRYKPNGPRKQIYSDGGGLYLEVAPNGARYWRLSYRFGGKQKLLAIGVYPRISLLHARDKRAATQKLLAAGIDPGQNRRIQKLRDARQNGNTFEAIAREWHELNISKWTPDYGANILHRLAVDMFPLLGQRPIGEIEAIDVLDTLRQVEKRGALEIAKRLAQNCGQVFRYAIATGRAQRNPVPDLKGALKPMKPGHFAALDLKELPDFIDKLNRNDARLYPLTRLAIRLMMLTFVRTSELIEARWQEFDLEGAQWVIPPERMKMRRPHVVPLSRQAVAILKELQQLSGQRDLVFPNQVRPRKPMSNNTVLCALARLGYKGKMTGHGFRALAMTAIKEKLGYRHEVIDRQLAHAHRKKVDAAYDRATFLEERAVMMQQWADYLDTLAAEMAAKQGPSPMESPQHPDITQPA